MHDVRPTFCGKSDRIVFPTDLGFEIWSRRGHETTLRMWSFHEAQVDQETLTATCFCVSNDGSHILAGTRNGTVLHWELQKSEQSRKISLALDDGSTTHASPMIIAMAFAEKTQCVVLSRDSIFLLDCVSLKTCVFTGASLPRNAGGIACTGDLSLIAVSSPSEITLYSSTNGESASICRVSSYIGHLQRPADMVFGQNNTLLSCDAKVPATMSWKNTSANSTADDSDVQYCDVCWTTHAMVCEIITNGSYALLLHNDGSTSIWRIDSAEMIQSFQTISSDFLIGRVLSADAFRVAYVKLSGETIFGGIQYDGNKWILKTQTKTSHLERTTSRKAERTGALPSELTGNALPQYEFEKSNIDDALAGSSDVGGGLARLQQALITADQEEFDRFLSASPVKLIPKCVHSVGAHQVETLIRLLGMALQAAENNVERLSMVIAWVKETLSVHKSLILDMEECRRSALLSPIRAILSEFAYLEDTVHSFYSRLQCLHEMQVYYTRKHVELSAQKKQRFYFRLK
ncbi:WD repeat-containing protein 18-like protein [Perkinsela sp. CCAP 1560/4]|nr:WD repeat-containing protein 18-like protein [Perkinsela sp. CCAP 1560/4]KNH08306.1 WD repeat-containing protein 18-like protein [Perkinsela sp. CCAP 1560/4]|eukprot:KNH03686.1 WD repeat-containing protein 18-like protein [Perkinsela sp. CCAP 1560/4]